MGKDARVRASVGRLLAPDCPCVKAGDYVVSTQLTVKVDKGYEMLVDVHMFGHMMSVLRQ